MWARLIEALIVNDQLPAALEALDVSDLRAMVGVRLADGLLAEANSKRRRQEARAEPPTRMHPADLERLADMIASRLAELPVEPPAGELVDAQEVARRVNVAPRWVRDHAAELGAVRVGDGPRPRLRFDPASVAEALTARSVSKGSPAPDRPVRRRGSRSAPADGSAGYPLLPVRGYSPGQHKRPPVPRERPPRG
jgi:hypothetical protein